MSTLYVLKEGEKRGPFTTEELEGKVAAGEFCPEDKFWTEGMEEWLPLSGIMQVEAQFDAETQAGATAAESPPEEAVGDSHSDYGTEDAVTLYDSDLIKVTTAEVELNEVLIPVIGIAKVSPQIEVLHRFRPLVGCVILGVMIVCLVLLEIPKTTVTHWVIWGVILLGLILWWVRCFYAAMRAPRSMLVIDLTDGDEHLVRLSPKEVTDASNAIKQAIAGLTPLAD